jgi:hypothetical protein
MTTRIVHDATEIRHERRATLGIVLSMVAILISVSSFVYPIVSSEVGRWSMAERYLTALIGVGANTSYSARGLAAEGSQADKYAKTVGVAWEAALDGKADTSVVTGGQVLGWQGTFEVCFANLDIFNDKCSTYADFEYSETNRVSRFTVDGLPVEQVFGSGNYDRPITTTGDTKPNQMQAYDAGRLYDPDGVTKTLMLRIMRKETSSASGAPLTFVSAEVQDATEAVVEIEAKYFPPVFLFWDDYFAVIRVPAEAEFVHVCWAGMPEAETGCDWVYRL